MQNSDDKQKFSKAKILAEIIYKAIVRYSISKKNIKSRKRASLSLDCERIWSANKDDIIDSMENKL